MNAKILILLEDVTEDEATRLADDIRNHLIPSKDITANMDNVVLQYRIPDDDLDFEWLRHMGYNMGYTDKPNPKDCKHKAVIMNNYNPLDAECAYCGDKIDESKENTRDTG